jgi:hypothetical protein
MATAGCFNNVTNYCRHVELDRDMLLNVSSLVVCMRIFEAYVSNQVG